MAITSIPLEALEAASYGRRHEQAAGLLSTLLESLNGSMGSLDGVLTSQVPTNLGAEEREAYVITRLAAAISCLFADPDFNLSDTGYAKLISSQRWLSLIFAASVFRNADHILRLFNVNGAGSAQFAVDPRSIPKICLLFSTESELPLDLDAMWSADPRLAACLAFVLISPRFLASRAAHSKREVLLTWLPQKLESVTDLDHLPLGILHDVYMHCSYADLAARHDVKRPINRLIRQKLEQQSILDIDLHDYRPGLTRGKPVMLVVLEWFTSNHSIYRTHSRTLIGARQYFHVVGVGSANCVDDAGKQVFDEFVAVDFEHAFCDLPAIRALAQQRRPAVLYMPSVGMFPATLFMTNVRFAPLQVVGCGHPATTHATCVDLVAVEEDYIGDPACFSEPLLRLPRNGMPYRPSSTRVDLIPLIRDRPDRVRIAVAASTMKLNPKFLEACRMISVHAKVPVQFQFMLGACQGLVYIQARNLIAEYLPYAVVHAHQPYESYMKALSQCDLYINPFPFGNTNGIVDTALLGMVGVCKTGPEVFEHIDEGLFRRLGFPEELIARSVAQYVAAAVKLIEQHAWRNGLRNDLLARDTVKTLFEGDDRIFGRLLFERVRDTFPALIRDPGTA